jgi:hypothetical protein
VSQHKTGLSNWTAKQKSDYWERRNRGLRGQIGYVKYHQSITDDKGNETKIPLAKIGGRQSQFMQPSAWQAANVQRQGFIKQERKASSRGN